MSGRPRSPRPRARRRSRARRRPRRAPRARRRRRPSSERRRRARRRHASRRRTSPVHSPRLWPATTSGRDAELARAPASSSRPTAKIGGPAGSSSVGAARRPGRRRPKWRGDVVDARLEGRLDAGEQERDAPAARRAGRAGSNQMSLRPRHGAALASSLRARARRSGVGSTTASAGRAGPVGAGRCGPDRGRASSCAARSAASRRRGARRARAAAARAARPPRRGGRGPGAPPVPSVLLEDDVGVDAAEAEGVDAAARRAAGAAPTARPRRATRKRVPASAGCGSSQCRVGGRTPWWTARAALIRPATPAAGMAWPIIDFTEPSAARAAVAGRRRRPGASVSSSAASPAGVAVPWASTSPTRGAGRGPRRVPGALEREHLAVDAAGSSGWRRGRRWPRRCRGSRRRSGRRRARRRPGA